MGWWKKVSDLGFKFTIKRSTKVAGCIWSWHGQSQHREIYPGLVSLGPSVYKERDSEKGKQMELGLLVEVLKEACSSGKSNNLIHALCVYFENFDTTFLVRLIKWVTDWHIKNIGISSNNFKSNSVSLIWRIKCYLQLKLILTERERGAGVDLLQIKPQSLQEGLLALVHAVHALPEVVGCTTKLKFRIFFKQWLCMYRMSLVVTENFQQKCCVSQLHQ